MLKGVDISNWQSVGAGDNGADFVICKATEGTIFVDPSCDKHYQRAKAQGKLLGVYHFARPDLNSAEAEAEFFVKNIKGYIGEAILALDYECAPYSDDWAYAFCKKVHDLTGVWPMLYASASKINEINWSKTAKNCGLWIAGYPNKYNVPNPPTPGVNDMPYSIGAWKFWAIWQYSSSAGHLDLDIANMDKATWKKYAAKNGDVKPEPTPTPAPTPAPSTGFKVGDKVTLKTWVDYKGNPLIKTRSYYTISEINGNRAVLKSDGVVYAAVNTANLTKYNSSGVTINYAVRKGDTLSAIAEKYGTTVQKIATDNGLANPDFILPGWRLIIRK